MKSLPMVSTTDLAWHMVIVVSPDLKVAQHVTMPPTEGQSESALHVPGAVCAVMEATRQTAMKATAITFFILILFCDLINYW